MFRRCGSRPSRLLRLRELSELSARQSLATSAGALEAARGRLARLGDAVASARQAARQAMAPEGTGDLRAAAGAMRRLDEAMRQQRERVDALQATWAQDVATMLDARRHRQAAETITLRHQQRQRWVWRTGQILTADEDFLAFCASRETEEIR